MTTTFNARDYINGQCMSDAHKDAYGFRPSAGQYAAWAEMSEAQLDAECERLYRAVERSIEQDEQAHLAAANAFEGLLRELIATGAADRATAIRWAVDAEGLTADDIAHYGMGYAEYRFGLKYGYIEEGRR